MMGCASCVGPDAQPSESPESVRVNNGEQLEDARGEVLRGSASEEDFLDERLTTTNHTTTTTTTNRQRAAEHDGALVRRRDQSDLSLAQEVVPMDTAPDGRRQPGGDPVRRVLLRRDAAARRPGQGEQSGPRVNVMSRTNVLECSSGILSLPGLIPVVCDASGSSSAQRGDARDTAVSAEAAEACAGVAWHRPTEAPCFSLSGSHGEGEHHVDTATRDSITSSSETNNLLLVKRMESSQTGVAQDPRVEHGVGESHTESAPSVRGGQSGEAAISGPLWEHGVRESRTEKAPSVCDREGRPGGYQAQQEVLTRVTARPISP